MNMNMPRSTYAVARIVRTSTRPTHEMAASRTSQNKENAPCREPEASLGKWSKPREEGRETD